MSILARVAVAFLIATSAVHAQPKSTPGVPVTLPGGLRIVVGGSAKGDSITLTAEQHKALLDRIEQLQAELDARKPLRPRSCELEGRVEQRGRQTVVRLKAVYKYTTHKPDAIVLLGGQKAQVVEAKLDDGKTPLLSAGDDGLSVTAPTPGDHILRLELESAIGPRGLKGSEIGFEVGLPGSPITALSFEPPTGVKRFSVVTRQPRPSTPGLTDSETESAEAERFQPGKGGAPLGSVTSLSLAWEDPTRKVELPRSADVDATVTIGPGEVVTEAKLRLRGGSSGWRFTAPASADVAVAPLGKADMADRLPDLIRPEPGQNVWRLDPRDGSPMDVVVTVTVRQPRGKPGEASHLGPFPVGPFTVLGVPQQSAVVRVRPTLQWKANATLKAGMARDADEPNGDTVYRQRIAEPKASANTAPLELTLAATTGAVDARVRHDLTLIETGWKLRSEIAVVPTRAEVEFVDVELPTTFRPALAEPREVVEEFSLLREAGPERQVYRARLASPRRTAFAFAVEGDYPVPATKSAATLPLPKVLNVAERSVEVTASAPARFEVRGVWRGTAGKTAWESFLEAEVRDGKRRLRGVSDRPIAAVELSWRIAPLSASVESEADADIDAERVRVRQAMTFRFPGRPPSRIHLRADRPLASVRASRGSVEPAGDGWDWLPPTDAGPEVAVVFHFAASAATPPKSAVTLTIPLLLPEADDARHTLRVWAASDMAAELVDAIEWQPSPSGPPGDRGALATLTVSAREPAHPPTVLLSPTPESAAPRSHIERAAIDVRLGDRQTTYRVRYWVRDWGELALVLPERCEGLEVTVGGRRWTAPSDAAEQGRVLPPAPATAGPTLVEIAYRRRQTASEPLVPPRMASPGTVGETTWSIHARPGWFAVVPGTAVAPWSPAALASTLGLGTADPPAAVIRQREPDALPVYQMARPTAVMVASLIAFLLAAVGFVSGTRERRWLVVAACVAVAVSAYLWPQPTARVVFAALPGLVSAAVFYAAFRLARAEHRRRLARAPGFARSKSSLVRPAPRDPSSRPSAPVVTGASSVRSG